MLKFLVLFINCECMCVCVHVHGFLVVDNTTWESFCFEAHSCMFSFTVNFKRLAIKEETVLL